MLKIFYLRISDFAETGDDFFRPLVRPETWEEVQSYKSETVRRTKLLGESMLWRLLEQERGLCPLDCHLVKAEHGKPYIEGISPLFFFNISHSGDYVVCALAEQEVGIDIECSTKARMKVALRYFHPGEIRCLEALSGEEQDRLFFAYWTAKESFLKYTGQGLSASLSAFEVEWKGEVAHIRTKEGILPVYIREYKIDKDYACAVCTGQPEEKAEIRNAFSLIRKI